MGVQLPPRDGRRAHRLSAPRASPTRRSRAFSERIVGILNDDVAAAHAETLDREKLRAAYEPVVARLGDDWDVAVSVPKTTLLQPYYDAAGIGGQYSPFSFETMLNASFLPFEVPRALAHEWAHVGGFTDEGDANYIGTLACLRSDDPLIRYSGAYWTYSELPEAQRRRLHLDRRVIADFQAGRERFLSHYKPQIFALQWRFYDRFLRSNGVRGGVASYGFFLQLLVGTPLDAQGLPVVRSGSAAPPIGGRPMIARLSSHWWLFLIRGMLAIALGILMPLFPGRGDLHAGDPVRRLRVRRRHRRDRRRASHEPRRGELVVAAARRRARHRRRRADVLLSRASRRCGWSTCSARGRSITGVLAIATAIRLRAAIANEIFMILLGALSVVAGIVIFFVPVYGVFALVWMISIYAFLAGIILIGLAFRLRGLRR